MTQQHITLQRWRMRWGQPEVTNSSLWYCKISEMYTYFSRCIRSFQIYIGCKKYECQYRNYCAEATGLSRQNQSLRTLDLVRMGDLEWAFCYSLMREVSASLIFTTKFDTFHGSAKSVFGIAAIPNRNYFKYKFKKLGPRELGTAVLGPLIPSTIDV